MPESSLGIIAEQGASKLFDLGVVGVFLVFCMVFMFWMYKSHRDERKEWRNETKEEMRKRDDEFLRTAERQVQSSDKLADAIAQLSRDFYRGGNNGGG